MSKKKEKTGILNLPFIFVAQFCVVIVMFIGCDRNHVPRQGEKAPDLELTDLNGKSHKLSEYKGKLVMLHFWTDWCEACRKEFPKLQQNYSEYQKEGLEIIAVNVGQPTAVTKEFQDNFNVTFPMLTDEQNISTESYNVTAYPTNYLINEDGVIVRQIRGWLDGKQIHNLLHGMKVNKG